MKLLIIVAMTLTMTSVAMAFPSFGKVFNSTYGIKKESNLGKAACGACHIGKSAKLNPYGLDMQNAMVSEKAKTLTGSVLKRIEGKDSDKDGKTNVEEIRADKNPGDPKDK